MCSYATLLKSKYDCHMRCHLNNKVIKCQRCNYSTINIRHMSKHERLHMINIKKQNSSKHFENSESPDIAKKNQFSILANEHDINKSNLTPHSQWLHLGEIRKIYVK